MELETLSTGAVKSKLDGKLRYDLIPSDALARVAGVCTRGAVTHGDANFEHGIPYMRCIGSLKRHLEDWIQCLPVREPTDDNIAQVAWYALILAHYEEQIKKGRLAAEVDDRPDSRKLPANEGNDKADTHRQALKAAIAAAEKAGVERAAEAAMWAEVVERAAGYLKPSKRKRLYISGPMRGYPDHNFPIFDQAKKYFEDRGWEVLSPADMDRGGSLIIDSSDPTEAAIQQAFADRDIAAIRSCDTVVLLDGWENSTGAQAEAHYARWTGKTFVLWKHGHPIYDVKLDRAETGYSSYYSTSVAQ